MKALTPSQIAVDLLKLNPGQEVFVEVKPFSIQLKYEKIEVEKVRVIEKENGKTSVDLFGKGYIGDNCHENSCISYVYLNAQQKKELVNNMLTKN